MVGLTKKPCVWICYDVPEAFYRWYKVPAFWWNKKIWRRSNRKIICSNITDAYSLEVIYRRKVNSILPLSIDWEYFSKGERKSSDTFRVCQVGTILRNKNQLDTIDTFIEFHEKVPNSTLTLVGPRIPTGSGPTYWNACEERIKDLDYIFMPGYLPKREVRNVYYNSDLYLNNLRGTGGWLAVLEALSSRLPIVSSKWFFGWDSIYPYTWVGDDILKGLTEAYENYEIYRKKAEEGSNWVGENLTYKNYVDKIMEV
jgi:glycosyltransferase involved in cell wall biosynthesis